MKIGDIMAILGVAAVTMVLIVAFAAPQQVDAIDLQDRVESRITPLISQPILELAGLEIKLTTEESDYAPGDKPVFLLETTNPTEHRIETSLWIGMTASSLMSQLSRAPTMPTHVWSKEVRLTLGPDETRHLQVATDTKLVAGNTVSITMSDTDQKPALARLLNLGVRQSRQD